MNTERDKYLTEAMGGKFVMVCTVDEFSIDGLDETCVMHPNYPGPITDCTYAEQGKTACDCQYWVERCTTGVEDFSTWTGFGKLWEWAQKQEWWVHFLITKTWERNDTKSWDNLRRYINPVRFADAIYSFLKERDNGKD